MEKNIDVQLELIKRGTVEIIQLNELKDKLEKAIAKNRPLIVKAGFDPTAPDITSKNKILKFKILLFENEFLYFS